MGSLPQGSPGSPCETVAKCKLCWSGDLPPYQHTPVPKHLPKTKFDIVKFLLANFDLEETSLQALTVPELTLKMKVLVCGGQPSKPHGQNPMTGITSLRKSQLEDLCLAHGLTFKPKTTMADMIQSMRAHWDDQCFLAIKPSDESPTQWSVISVAEPNGEVNSGEGKGEEGSRSKFYLSKIYELAYHGLGLPEVPPLPKRSTKIDGYRNLSAAGSNYSATPK